MSHDERIPEGQFREAVGAGPRALEGKTIARVFEIEGTDRGEFALLTDDGRLYLVSCDPGYDAEGIHRTPDHWEVYLSDASGTEAGREFGRRAS